MRKLLSIALALCLVPALTGCSAQQKAQGVYDVIEGIVIVAQAEAPNVPVEDQAIYNGLVAFAGSLADQLKVCIDAPGAKFLTCFQSFANGLNSPTELAQLRILSPKSQHKVQIYVSAIVAGVNAGLTYFGGKKSVAPVISPAPASQAELRELADQIGYQGAL